MREKYFCLFFLSIFLLAGNALYAQNSNPEIDSIRTIKIKNDSSSLSVRKALRSGKGSQPSLQNQGELKLENSESSHKGIYPDTLKKNLLYNADSQKPMEVNRKDCLVL